MSRTHPYLVPEVELTPQPSPKERRATHRTEVVYALFVFVIGVLFFATAV